MAETVKRRGGGVVSRSRGRAPEPESFQARDEVTGQALAAATVLVTVVCPQKETWRRAGRQTIPPY